MKSTIHTSKQPHHFSLLPLVALALVLLAAAIAKPARAAEPSNSRPRALAPDRWAPYLWGWPCGSNAAKSQPIVERKP